MSKTYAEACQLIEDMAMNSYMWSTKLFTYRVKQSIVNTASCEEKYQQVLERLNQLKMSSTKVQVQNQPILIHSNVGHDGEGAMWGNANEKNQMEVNYVGNRGYNP
ncbi:hypothetical protein EPI10_015942 [Gossypium australe]|uniref:Uncharacterized protein n=1 Tax=Gossypium australe TaxID=47621 RepID=A0A5B6VML1_9ROSI|nr:hypothetical protein EPI10_015942 [Gossypium australe]